MTSHPIPSPPFDPVSISIHPSSICLTETSAISARCMMELKGWVDPDMDSVLSFYFLQQNSSRKASSSHWQRLPILQTIVCTFPPTNATPAGPFPRASFPALLLTSAITTDLFRDHHHDDIAASLCHRVRLRDSCIKYISLLSVPWPDGRPRGQ